MDETKLPPWLETMKGLAGITAAGGNSIIVGWAKKIGEIFPEYAHYCSGFLSAKTAWCGLTAGYCMAMNGIKPPAPDKDDVGFLYALRWRAFGVDASHDPQVGDIAVFHFGGNDHHVTMIYKVNKDTFECLGGNQSHSVKLSTYKRSECIAIRRPVH